MDKQHFLFIAYYEAKTLSREWSFRFMTILSVISVAFLQLLTQSDFNHPKWASISLVSAIPYANAYLINHIQIFITIFLAGKFLFQQKSSDTIDAIRVRPYCNQEYLWGKISGFILAMIVLDGILMLLAIFIHLFASESPWGFYPYLFYFFTLTIPTLLFIIGLTVSLKSIIRHQALTILLLCVFFYWEISYGDKFLNGSFDIFASSLPNTFSEWTGFSGLERYLTQRVIFLLWGIGLLFLSVQFLPRLIDKQKILYSSQVIGIIFLAISIIPVWAYQSSFSRQQTNRDSARQLFTKYEKQLKAQIKEHHICFQQSGNTFSANSRLTISNPHTTALPFIILYLNPGLTVKEIILNGEITNFQREGQIIIIPHSLLPEEEQIVQLHYHGTPSQDVCYAEYERLEDFPPSRHYSFFNYGQEMFFLHKNFTLLTPEIMWYPTSIAPVNVLSPYSTVKTFTTFSLDVIGEKERMVISQGKIKKLQDTIRFSNTQKLTGLSLCMGNYTCLADTIENNICTELYLFKEHEHLFANIDPKSLKEHLKKILAPTPLFPWEKTQKYPLQKLAFIEIPIHFCAYSRYWKDETEQLQPELVFRPELEATGRTNPKFNPASPKYKDLNPGDTPLGNWLNSYNTQTLESERSSLNNNLFFDFLSINQAEVNVKNETQISLLWKSNAPYIYSSEFPGIDMILNFIPIISEDVLNQYSDIITAPINIKYLQQHNLETAFHDAQAHALVPKLIPAKTSELIKQLFLILPFKSFENFISQFQKKHPLETINFELFCQEYQKISGIDILPTIRKWYYTTGLPSFLIRDVKFYSMGNDQDEELVIATLKVWNKSSNDGILSVSCNNSGVQHYQIPAQGVKEIRIAFHKEEQMTLKVSSDLSQNIPNNQEFTDIPITTTRSIPELGMFDTDTNAFTPNPNEYIVDNDSKGFRIIGKSKLRNLLKKETNLTTKTAGPSPKEWTSYVHSQAFGEPVKSYYCKLSGKGENNVEWQTQLSETGEYELFVYINYGFFDYCKLASNHPITTETTLDLMTQTYIFTHQKGEENIEIEIDKSCDGWISLGKYNFSKGTAKVMLTDRGAYPEQNLYVDAIKWVRIK